jgi:histidine transport system permease protein
MMRRIVLPSALRRAIPAYSNEVIYLLHATSLAFAVTVKDLMAVARDVNASTFRSFEAFGIAAFLYLLTTLVLLFLFKKAEARWLRHLQTSRH